LSGAGAQSVEHAIARDVLELALLAQEADDAKGDGVKQAFYLFVIRRRQRSGAGHLRVGGQLLEDGLWQEDVEVRRQLKRRAKALNERQGSGMGVGDAEPAGRLALEGEERANEEGEDV